MLWELVEKRDNRADGHREKLQIQREFLSSKIANSILKNHWPRMTEKLVKHGRNYRSIWESLSEANVGII